MSSLSCGWNGAMPTRSVAVVIGALAILVAGCGGVQTSARDSTSVIDGWLVGPLTVCQDRVVHDENDVEIRRGRCVDLVAAAAKALDHRDPGHPAVVAMQLHQRQRPPNTGGGLQYVAVYSLADGSVRAIGVGWPGVATTPLTIDYGP
jgi:hypothetical protein